MFGQSPDAAVGVDELGVDLHLVAARLDRAFEDVVHAEFPTDRFCVDRLALVGHGGVPRDDEAVVDAREAGRQFVRQGVDEVVLRRVAGEVGEGCTTIESRAASGVAPPPASRLAQAVVSPLPHLSEDRYADSAPGFYAFHAAIVLSGPVEGNAR